MTRPVRAAAPTSADPLFAVAMLRIALELKKNRDTPLEAAVTQVVTRMQLDGEAFRHYLDENLGLLKATTGAAVSPQPAAARPAPAHAQSRRTQRR